MVAAVLSVLSVVLGAAFAFVATYNAYCLLRGLTRSHGPSVVPIIGGLLGIAAVGVAPAPALRPYWWVPLVLDCSSPLLAVGVFRMLPDLWRLSRWNLLRQYRGGQTGGCSVLLKLFRGGRCLILLTFNRRPDEVGLTTISMPGAYRLDGGRLCIDLTHTPLDFREVVGGGLELSTVSGDPELVHMLSEGGTLRLARLG